MSTHSTVQPVRPEPGSIWPSSHLTAEQEIRARAVEIAVRRWSDLAEACREAEEIAAYIRDGKADQ
jgi:hypothetical protein